VTGLGDPVSRVLEERDRRLLGGNRWAPRAIAALLHVLLGAAIWLAPSLDAKPRPAEFVAVQIVPQERLGARAAVSAPPATKPETKPAVEPPKPKPPSMTLPAPDKRREPKPVPPAPREPSPPPAASADRDEPKGSPEGLAGDASAFGTAVSGLDNPDFTYGYYLDQMLKLIQSQWTRPPLGGEIECTVHFFVGRDGRVKNLEIVRSSGYGSFDLAGLRAVQAAAPLPPLPRGYGRDSLGVTLVIR
jgi:protein TonB